MASSRHSKHTCATLTVCVMGELLVEEAVDEAAALNALVVDELWDELWAETMDDPSKESTVKRVRRQVRE
jgi:hypothetical protein